MSKDCRLEISHSFVSHRQKPIEAERQEICHKYKIGDFA